MWRFYVLGIAKIYGLAGETGLKAFYDEQNISRFPGMSANLRDAAWVLKVSSQLAENAQAPYVSCASLCLLVEAQMQDH